MKLAASRPQELNNGKMPAMFKKQLQKCKLKPGETVLLITDMTVRDDYVHSTVAAAEELGAYPYEIRLGAVPSRFRVGTDVISQCKGAMDAIAKADLIVIFHLPIWTAWMGPMLRGGGRILLIEDGPDDLVEIMSPDGLKEAAMVAKDLLANAKSFHMYRNDGSDLSWEGGQYRDFVIWGAADEPGHFDSWGGGMAQMFPKDNTASGHVRLEPGDIIILPYSRYISEPVEIKVEDGFMTSIEGGLDAKLISDWLEDNKDFEEDKDPWAVSHMGFGFNPQARWYWNALAGSEPERNRCAARMFPGNFLFSCGPNTLGGGNRKTMGHCDIPMRDCTLEIDGQVVIDKGRLVDPRLNVAREERG